MPIVQEKPPTSDTEPLENPRAVMGGNEPPLEEQIAMEFREALLSERHDFLVRMTDAIAAVDRAVVTDDETLGKAGDLAKILRACEGLVADVHKVVKEPHLARGRACDAEKNALTSKITAARSKLSAVMNGYMAEREAARRAEEQRQAAIARAAAEEAARAERAAQEAEAAAQRAIAEAKSAEDMAAAEREAELARNAAAQMAEKAALSAHTQTKAEPVRSDSGSSVSGRTVWNSQVEDYKVAVRAVLDDAKVREAVDAAVARLVKAGKREIKGVRVWPTTQAVAR